jgi:predicted DNA-binding WGR domain protein
LGILSTNHSDEFQGKGMEQRSLQYTDGKSNKFWIITLKGLAHTVQYGRSGTTGQTQTKEFATENEARKSFEKLVAEKLKKGYVETEVEASVTPIVTVVSEPTASIKAVETQSETPPPQTLPANWQELARSEIQDLGQNRKQLCELAAIDAIPYSAWEFLSLEIRVAIAKSPIPPSSLTLLALDQHESVREAVGENLDTPEEALSKLADDKNADVRLAIARNHNTPPVVLVKLVNDPYGKIRTAVASYQNVSEETLREELARPLPSYTNNEIASHPDWLAYASADTLENFPGWSNDAMLAMVKNPRLSEQKLLKITSISFSSSGSSDWASNWYCCQILSAIVHHPNTTFQVIERLVQRLAQEGITLAENEQITIDCHVARHPETPLEKLAELCQKKNLRIKRAISQHPHGLPLLLLPLIKKAGSLARYLGLQHSQLPQNVLEKASQSKDWHDRYAIIQNLNTPRTILEQLAQDEHPFVQAAARSGLGLEVVYSSPAEPPEASAMVDPQPAIVQKVVEVAPVALKIERSLNLSPEDWLWATWRPRNPQPLPSPKPFDRDQAWECLNKLYRDARNSKQRNVINWSDAQLIASMTRQEAHFWFLSMAGGDARQTKRLGEITLAEARHQIIQHGGILPPEVMLPISNLFPAIDFIVMLFEIKPSDDKAQDQVNAGRIASASRGIVEGFRAFVLPYLTDADVNAMRDRLQPLLNPHQYQYWQNLYQIAGSLGMHDELWILQQTGKGNSRPQYYIQGYLEHAFGFNSAQAVENWMREKSMWLKAPTHIRAWLAHTEYKALDFIRSSILQANHDGTTVTLLQTFADLVNAPEAAFYMLELMLATKASKIARDWLDLHPHNAIVGLLPVAAGHVPESKVGRNKLSEAAINYLCVMKRKGYQALIDAVLEQESPEVATKVRMMILEQEPPNYTLFDHASTPQWLRDGIVDLPFQKRAKSPSWVSSVDLPSIVVGDRRLNEEQINACLTALSLSTLDSPLSLVQHLKAFANQQSLDSFSWNLFERWLTEGAPSKEKWAMTALGLLGSDAIALKLAPLIRNWPGENQHPRAVLGLECLRTIGTDTALMQINGIAQKTKYQGLQTRAEECMAAIARDRQLTSEQLADRIVPDCGLDTTGKRIFDYGARQFHFVLGADLKPMVKDERGKFLTSLPKPNASDNPEQAQQAIADWKLLKKQVSEVVKIQSIRLEQAMINDRRWTWQEFQVLLVQHPLMTHLAQRLVWQAHDSNEPSSQTFRVAEDQTFTNANDEVFTLNDTLMVGLVHPLQLSPEIKASWGQILGDYEIIPPFSQMSREIYTLNPEELADKDITRFKNIEISTAALVRTVENSGWRRGRTDQGEIQTHWKYFPKFNVTAVIGEYENVFHGGDVYGTEVIDGCCFVAGEYTPEAYPCDRQWVNSREPERILLQNIEPLLLSEILRELTAIAALAEGR